ncbi:MULTISPECIES: hypothetical protein [unclassified Streptomyces]|uniref:hypothetical protein n=1 Tax=unclassified Streptomyces TaxID=2593676 RepID=UPI0038042AC5
MTQRSGPSRRAVLVGLALAAPVVAAGCGGGHDKSSASKSPAAHDPGHDTTIMIIRHGEKPASGDPGFDEAGKQDKKSLTRRGWDRAHALPRLFLPDAGAAPTGAASATPSAGASANGGGSPGSSGSALLPRPATVYAAADHGPQAGAHRMRQTVTPLGEALHLPVNTDFAEGKEKDLAAAALAATAPVLICWEHSRIPPIVEALGASQATGVPKVWPDRFDLVWLLTRRSGTWTFRSMPQHLLPGDAS